MRPRTTIMILIALTAGALAGCTSTSAQAPSAAQTGTPAAGAPVTPPVTTTQATTPARTSTSPATTPARPATSRATSPARCTSAQLRFAAARSDGAAGTLYESIRVTNIGPGTCWTHGYVRLQILDAAGRKLPTATLPGAIALRHEPRRVR
jgi:ABC-type transport system substrate-binding protein